MLLHDWDNFAFTAGERESESEREAERDWKKD